MTLRPVPGRGPEREAAPAAADVEHPVALVRAPACGRPSRASPPARPPASPRRARRPRSCRSSSRRGRARRTRWRRRSGGGPRAASRSLLWRRPLGRSSEAGRRGGRETPAARTAPSSSRALSAPSRGRRLPAVEQLDHRVHVVDLDVAADVGAAEAELARRAQRVGGGARRAHVEGRPRPVGRRQPRAVPELDRERSLGDAALDLPPQCRGAGERHRAQPTRFPGCEARYGVRMIEGHGRRRSPSLRHSAGRERDARPHHHRAGDADPVPGDRLCRLAGLGPGPSLARRVPLPGAVPADRPWDNGRLPPTPDPSQL